MEAPDHLCSRKVVTVFSECAEVDLLSSPLPRGRGPVPCCEWEELGGGESGVARGATRPRRIGVALIPGPGDGRCASVLGRGRG